MEEVRIGVYVCHCGVNISKTVDVKAVAEFAQSLPNVVIARDYLYMCSEPGQDLIKRDIKEYNLNRVVVASCSPRMHEPTFRGCIFEVGLNPYLFEMANIREQCSWVHDDKLSATEKAKDLVRSAVMRATFLEPLVPKTVPVTKRALVIGGGIAGIQAALDIADAGYQVYLVEKLPSIGGRMAQLEKTFPTLDCAACILTPKMVDVARQENITLLTYSEVEDIAGTIGNFKVKVRKKARFVSPQICNACQDCEFACPVSVKSEFDLGLKKRKAIYRPFPQAVPNVYTIDRKGISPCRAGCPAGVNAHGYIALIAQGKYEEALRLEREANPFASVCGRVCNHPCEGECNRKEAPIAIASLKRFIADHWLKNGKRLPEPVPKTKSQRIAVVGTGPAGLSCAYFLAKKGYWVTCFEKLPEPGGMLINGIPEFRLPREAVQADIDFILAHGIELKTGMTLGKDFYLEDLFLDGFDCIFLATGAYRDLKLNIPGEELEGVYSSLDFLIPVNRRLKDFTPIVRDKTVCVIGGGNAAFDTARVALRLGAKRVRIIYRRSQREMPAHPWEREEAEKEGVEIIYLAAPTRIIGAERVRAIECQKMELAEPDATGRRRPIPIPGSEFILECDLLISAIGQMPDTSFLPNLAKTRWGTLVVDSETLMTSQERVFAGGDLVSGPATIIEGVAMGKKAAESIDHYLTGTKPLEEKRPAVVRFGEEEYRKFPQIPRTQMRKIPISQRKDFSEVELGFSEEEARREAERCLNCAVCCECRECVRVCKPGAIDFTMEDEILELEVGAIVLATGYDEFDPTLKPEFGFGKYPEVITGLQAERLLSASGPTGGEFLINGKRPKDITFIHCVGSRDKQIGNEYCSRVCCMYIAKQAHLLKERMPDARITVFYMDVRAFGKGYEEFYDRVKQEGIIYRRGNPSEIYREGDKLIVRVEDTLLGEVIEHKTDCVVLGTGLVPSRDNKLLASLLKLSLSPDRFFLEAHPKLRPVDSTIDGVYLAGTCQGPKDIPDTVAQAKGAAASVIALLNKDEITIEPIVAEVSEERCSGCHICEGLCPYQALIFNPEKKVMVVESVLCKGCGVCFSACPSGAITLKHYTKEETLAQINALV
jgi:heterodisulfide reductase subunit A